MSQIPTLTTQRLRLRAHERSDLDACAGLWSSPIVTRYIGGRPFSREEVWARLLRYAGHWAWLGFGFWLIEEAGTGRFIGEIGLADFQRDILPPLDNGPEAGWVLLPEACGKGFATEALSAVLAWSDNEGGMPAVCCLIHPENTASVRVAKKCGFLEQRRVLYKGQSSELLIRDSG